MVFFTSCMRWPQAGWKRYKRRQYPPRTDSRRENLTYSQFIFTFVIERKEKKKANFLVAKLTESSEREKKRKRKRKRKREERERVCCPTDWYQTGVKVSPRAQLFSPILCSTCTLGPRSTKLVTKRKQARAKLTHKTIRQAKASNKLESRNSKEFGV